MKENQKNIIWWEKICFEKSMGLMMLMIKKVTQNGKKPLYLAMVKMRRHLSDAASKRTKKRNAYTWARISAALYLTEQPIFNTICIENTNVCQLENKLQHSQTMEFCRYWLLSYLLTFIFKPTLLRPPLWCWASDFRNPVSPLPDGSQLKPINRKNQRETTGCWKKKKRHSPFYLHLIPTSVTPARVCPGKDTRFQFAIFPALAEPAFSMSPHRQQYQLGWVPHHQKLMFQL